MTYDITPMTSVTDLGGLARGTNEILGGNFYGYIILATVFLTMFLFLAGRGMTKSSCFTVSAWVCMLLAFVLTPIGILPVYGLWMTVFLVVASLFAMWLANSTG